MAKKSKVIDEDSGYNRALRALARMTGDPGITLGIHEEDGAEPYQRGSGQTVTTAMIGSFHEFGTLDRFDDDSPAGDGRQGVPMRSFLRSTVDENRSKYSKAIAKGIGDVLDGKSTIKRALGRVGAVARGDVQKKIASGIEPALTAETVERKGSSKPLVDTGQLRQAIDYQVED